MQCSIISLVLLHSSSSCAVEHSRCRLQTQRQAVSQVTATVLCADGATDASCVAINAVSAALLGSSTPWNGPLAAVQVAVADQGSGPGPAVVQPSAAQLAKSSLAGLYVGTASNTLLADLQVSTHLRLVAAALCRRRKGYALGWEPNCNSVIQQHTQPDSLSGLYISCLHVVKMPHACATPNGIAHQT